MYFKFNQMLGRAVPSTQTEAYVPQGFTTKLRPTPVIIFDSKTTKLIHDPVPTEEESLCSFPQLYEGDPQDALFGVVPTYPQYHKIMMLQNRFLNEDGKVVWLKLGKPDRMKFYATLGMTLIGSLFCLKTLYRMTFPPLTADNGKDD